MWCSANFPAAVSDFASFFASFSCRRFLICLPSLSPCQHASLVDLFRLRRFVSVRVLGGRPTLSAPDDKGDTLTESFQYIPSPFVANEAPKTQPSAPRASPCLPSFPPPSPRSILISNLLGFCSHIVSFTPSTRPSTLTRATTVKGDSPLGGYYSMHAPPGYIPSPPSSPTITTKKLSENLRPLPPAEPVASVYARARTLVGRSCSASFSASFSAAPPASARATRGRSIRCAPRWAT